MLENQQFTRLLRDWANALFYSEYQCVIDFQAKTQAVLECHNFWMVAPNKGSKINGKIGDEPVFFYEPFIGQDVSVVDVVVRIRQKSIERPMDCIVFS